MWQYSWQRLTALKTFCLQTATLLSVLAIGLKNIWRLTGTSNSCIWLSLSVILCVVVCDNRSKSIMAMSLHMNLCALFMIRVFPSLCSRLAWCSRKMLLVPSLRQSTSPLLWCVVKNKMSWYFSLWVLSLATSWNKGGSYLVTDQTVWADSLPKIFLFIFYFYCFFWTIIYRNLNLSRFFYRFPWELNFNILKHVITHLYKHICERNCWVFMFIFIFSSILLACMKWWKNGYHLGLMQLQHLYNIPISL